nr:hypothetical protein [Pandoraea sp.]
MGEYAVRVYRVCDAGSTTSCRIDTLTYLTEPIKKTYSSDPDFNLAAVAAKQMGAYGGLSTVENAGEFRFIGQAEGALPVGNPLAVPGLIAMRGGSQTKDLNIAMVRDGSRGATGPLKMYSPDANGGLVRQNIEGVADINSEGTISARNVVTGAASVKGRLDLTSGTDEKPVFNNIVGAGNIEGKGELKMASASVGALTATTDGATLTGTLDLQNNDIESAKSLSADKVSAEKLESRDLKSKSGVVELGDSVTAGEVCDVWGLGRDTAGRILSCQSDGNAWRWTLAMHTPTVPEVKKPDVPDPKVVEPPVNRGQIITKFTLVGTNTPGRSTVPGFKLAKASSGSTQCKFSSNPAIQHINSIADEAWRDVYKAVDDGTERVAPSEFIYFPTPREGYRPVASELVCLSTGSVPVLLRLEEVLGNGPVPARTHTKIFRSWEGRPVVNAVLEPIGPTQTVYESNKSAFRRNMNDYQRIKSVPQVYRQGLGGGWQSIK